MDKVLDFDGDKVQLSVRGQIAEVFACDEIDKIRQKIADADKANPLPEWVNPETLLPEPGTHARGEEFINIVREHFKSEHNLDVRPQVAYAVWNALTHKADEYRDSFLNGPSSPASSDSPRPVSSADARANALLSSMQEESAPTNDSKNSTTASPNRKTVNAH